MRRRICCVGLLAVAGLGLLAAPVRAEDGIAESEDVYVGVGGERLVELGPNETTTSCTFNAARQVACAVLYALTPIKVDLHTKDGTRVLVTVDAHPAPAPTPSPDDPSIVIPLPDPIGPVTIPLPTVG